MMQCFKVQVPERELPPKLNATLRDSQTRSSRSLLGSAKTAWYLRLGTIKPRLSSNRGIHDVRFSMGYPPVPIVEPHLPFHPTQKRAIPPKSPAKLCGEETPVTKERASVAFQQDPSFIFILIVTSARIASYVAHQPKGGDVEQGANPEYRGEHMIV
jgi:hypothetical protein